MSLTNRYFDVSARRCSRCGLLWPPDSLYATCPVCLETTSPFSNATAMPKDEAVKLSNEANFRRACEARDLNRVGPSPEELGRKDAQKLLDYFWREIDAATR